MDQQRATFGSDRDSQAADPDTAERADELRDEDHGQRTESPAPPVRAPRRYP